MFLEQQISILEWFLKDHVTLKTEVMINQAAHQPLTLDSVISNMNVEDQVYFFINRCSNILDLIAPRKLINLKHKSQPWMNSDIWVLRQECRQWERRWKKDRLQVSYEMLRDSLCTFQKAAKAKHLPEIIAKNSRCSRTLFLTIDSVLNPQCRHSQSFLLYYVKISFADKVNSVKVQLATKVNPVLDPVLSNIQCILVSVQTCREITINFKSTFSLHNIMPSQFVKQTFETIGSDLVTFINRCLLTVVVLDCFKLASVLPIRKKPSLDPAVHSNFRPISPFLSKILEKNIFLQ